MDHLKASLTTAARLTWLLLLFGAGLNPAFVVGMYQVGKSSALAVAIGGFVATFTGIPVLLFRMVTCFENGGYYVVDRLPKKAAQQYVAHRPFKTAAETAWITFLLFVSVSSSSFFRDRAWSFQNFLIAITAMYFGYASGLTVVDGWCWILRKCKCMLSPIDYDRLDQARARLRDFDMAAELNEGVRNLPRGITLDPTASPA